MVPRTLRIDEPVVLPVSDEHMDFVNERRESHLFIISCEAVRLYNYRSHITLVLRDGGAVPDGARQVTTYRADNAHVGS